jgi:hypothetical protein
LLYIYIFHLSLGNLSFFIFYLSYLYHSIIYFFIPASLFFLQKNVKQIEENCVFYSWLKSNQIKNSESTKKEEEN